MSLTKIVIKSSTKISLHDRFTELRRLSDKNVASPSTATASNNASARNGFANAGGDNNVQPRSNPTSPRTPRRQHQQHQQYGYGGGDRGGFRRGRGGILTRPRRTNVVEAAMKIKKRSLKQRLGVRPNNYQAGIVYYNGGGYRFRGNYSRGRGRFIRRNYRGRGQGGNMRRWGSSTSIASNGSKRGGGRGGGNRRGLRRSRSLQNLSRGYRRRGGRGGRGRGRGGRGGQQKTKPPTKEELDQQLDNYMSNTKSALDKQLDTYMMNQD